MTILTLVLAIALPSFALELKAPLSSLPHGTILTFKRDIMLPVGEQAFHINDTYNPFKAHSTPQRGTSHCSLMTTGNPYTNSDIIRSGDRYKITSAVNAESSRAVSEETYRKYFGVHIPHDSYLATVLRLRKIDSEGKEIPSAMERMVCRRARMQTFTPNTNLTTERIVVERRSEPTISEFISNISSFIAVQVVP